MKAKDIERVGRAKTIVSYLKKKYPHPKSELNSNTDFQFLVSVILSAQCTDKKVNEVTETLFKKYKSINDFANVDIDLFANDISSITFFNNKAKNIVNAAKKINTDFGGVVPRTEKELIALPGVAYKTAHVVLGELFDVWDGIATDTHVRRFATRFGLTDNTDLTKISKDLELIIPIEDWKYVNNGFVLYGRYVCPARKHDCEHHPLTEILKSSSL